MKKGLTLLFGILMLIGLLAELSVVNAATPSAPESRLINPLR